MGDSSEVAVTGHHQFALCESIMLAAYNIIERGGIGDEEKGEGGMERKEGKREREKEEGQDIVAGYTDHDITYTDIGYCYTLIRMHQNFILYSHLLRTLDNDWSIRSTVTFVRPVLLTLLALILNHSRSHDNGL